jgi:nucleoside diphosphate kinase
MGKAFKKLAGKITREYEKKGYSVKQSKYIGSATAANIYRRQKG